MHASCFWWGSIKITIVTSWSATSQRSSFRLSLRPQQFSQSATYTTRTSAAKRTMSRAESLQNTWHNSCPIRLLLCKNQKRTPTAKKTPIRNISCLRLDRRSPTRNTWINKHYWVPSLWTDERWLKSGRPRTLIKSRGKAKLLSSRSQSTVACCKRWPKLPQARSATRWFMIIPWKWMFLKHRSPVAMKGWFRLSVAPRYWLPPSIRVLIVTIKRAPRLWILPVLHPKFKPMAPSLWLPPSFSLNMAIRRGIA